MVLVPLALAFLVLEVVWVHAFLTRLRPWLRERIGQDLGIRIVDGPKGSWAAAPGSGLAKGFLIGVLDITLLIGATLGPLALVLVLAFLVFG